MPEPNRIASSTKSRWVRYRLGATLMPNMWPLLSALVINQLSPSMISINRRGDRGQPCLIPLDTWKNFEGVPLISTTKFADSTQPMIQFTKVQGIPICKSTSLKKDQLTLSKAFTRSSLSTNTLCFSTLIVWRASHRIPTGSMIYLFCKNPNWCL